MQRALNSQVKKANRQHKLNRLHRLVAHHEPVLQTGACVATGFADIDAYLSAHAGGGLPCGGLHEVAAGSAADMAAALGFSGRWEEGIEYGKKAMRLAPSPPVSYFWILGRAYFMTGEYDKAIETFQKAVGVNPDYLVAHTFLAACYSSLDRHAEAAAAADEVRRINPQFTLEAYAKIMPFKKADIERYIAALRKAGLK